MVGLDIYTDPSSSMSGQWSEALDLFDGNKMIALSETGTLPNPDLMDQWGIEWSYFSPWKGSFVDAMNPADLQATLGHEDVIILDELPVLPWNANGQFLSADFDFSGSVDGADLAALLLAFGVTGAADTDGDSDTDGSDFLAWQQQVAVLSSLGNASAQIPEPSSLALLTMAVAAGCCRRKF